MRALARERNAVILAHNYQLPEVQDVADYVGDSLGLSRQAAATDADVIAFCGVHFMAETASVLSPEKTVLIPDADAGCSLADSITPDQLRAWQAKHPGAITVMYVNTTAEIKALTDYCVTSSNAVAVVEHILREHGPDTEILFGPDMFLGAYVEKTIGRPMHVWDGECHVHAGIRPRDITRVRGEHPGADFLIHPECGCSTSVMEYVAAGDVDAEGVHMLSTGGMMTTRSTRDAGRRTAIMATETGMLHPLQMAAPGRRLHRRQRGRDLPLHEDDHAAEAARLPARPDRRGQGPRGHRERARVPDRAHGRHLLSAPVNTFAGGGIDRVAPRRTDEAWLARALADPASRAVIATADGVLVDGAAPVLVPMSEVAGAGRDRAARGRRQRPALRRGPGARARRGAAARRRGAGPARCGGDGGDRRRRAARPRRRTAELAPPPPLLRELRRADGDAARPATCASARAAARIHHPRTDPVVITLVHDGDRVAARAASRRGRRGRYSALAGFVEPGESLEEAVAREIGEEAASTVARRALPLVAAVAVPGLAHARLRGGLRAAASRTRTTASSRTCAGSRAPTLERAVAGEGEPMLPPPLAIARRLIEGWLQAGRA